MTRRFRLLPLLVALGLLALCLGACAPAAAFNAQPTFDPIRAFTGRSHGIGTLSVVLQEPQPFHVESYGFTQPDGTFRLDQRVKFSGEPPQKRHWLLKQVSPKIYTGTLSGAEGLVKGHTSGPWFDLVYSLPGNLTMHQTLTLEPGGKTIDNVGRITFLGVQIGYLHETIERRGTLKQTDKGRPSAVGTTLAKPLR